MNGNLSLEQRYLAVQAQDRRAAEAAGREPRQRPPAGRQQDLFRRAASGNWRRRASCAFGENYLQEALGKMAALASLGRAGQPMIGWFPSLCGRRPSPGARRGRSAWPHGTRLAGSRVAFHRTDPVEQDPQDRGVVRLGAVGGGRRIARRLSEQRPVHLPPLQVCLQVNVSGEASKSGCEPDEVGPWRGDGALARHPAARLDGDTGADRRRGASGAAVRRRCGNCSSGCGEQPEEIGAPGAGHFDTLSMGMSADLEAAIAQGATIVRVGSALFGERTRPA